MKKWIIIGSISAVALSGFAFVADAYFEVSKQLDIFTTAYKELNTYYVDPVDPAKTMTKAMEAMLESLDPYTNYIPESDVEDYRFITTGQYGGIGSTISVKGDYIAIREPYEGKPAQKAGLIAGDLIIEVDGKSIKGKSSQDVTKLLKGTPGTMVKVLIRRGEEKDRIFEIKREEIKINNVPYYGMINDNIGYIQLRSFTQEAGKEVKEALQALKKDNPGIKGLVFDVRGNPGGLLNEAVNIVNVFTERGQLVVTTRGKLKDSEKEYKTINTPVDLDLPMVVLTNSGSASASEIVSGSIQDLDRGVVLGQRTFGKGLVQTTRPLSYNAQMKITTAKYYIPSGRCIQALDYSNRNEDGSVGKVPDSLMKEFKTKNGRTVKDGGGVAPDIATEPQYLAPITASLITKNLIFDYATLYKTKHNSIASAKEFKVSEADYNEFLKFIENKEYDYTTKSEKLLKDLKEAAEKEKAYDPIAVEYEALKAKISRDKKADVQRHKQEITEALTGEIVSRYYYQKGETEATFGYDNDIKRAIEVLNNKAEYNKLLSKK